MKGREVAYSTVIKDNKVIIFKNYQRICDFSEINI